MHIGNAIDTRILNGVDDKASSLSLNNNNIKILINLGNKYVHHDIFM